jgi:hypothetical protein
MFICKQNHLKPLIKAHLAHFNQLVITSEDPNIHYYSSHFLHNTESLKLNLNIHSQSFSHFVAKNREPLKEKKEAF